MGATKQITKPKIVTYEIKPSGDYIKIRADLQGKFAGELYAREVDSGQTLFITGLDVPIEYRQRGIASQMNALLIAFARAHDYKLLFCTIGCNDEIMKSIMFSKGFFLLTRAGTTLYYYQNLP